jgi:hypothetical protein
VPRTGTTPQQTPDTPLLTDPDTTPRTTPDTTPDPDPTPDPTPDPDDGSGFFRSDPDPDPEPDIEDIRTNSGSVFDDRAFSDVRFENPIASGRDVLF